MAFKANNHVFNVAKIVKIIKENRKKNPEEANLYEKVNLLFKGAAIGSPELIDDILAIVNEQQKELKEHLLKIKKDLAKS